ncbi:MAG: hypothetical protein ACQETE_11355 [Bacteroidota bacterium]
MKRWVTLCLVILLAGIIGCDVLTYKPEGKNHHEIDATPVKVTIDLEVEEDTIGVWGQVQLNLDLDSLHLVQLKSLEVYLDEEKIESEYENGQLTFQSSDYEDGIYDLAIVASTTTGTGSLADHLGVETTIYADTTKDIWIDNGPLNKTDITNIELVEGKYLKVEWERYDRPRFEGYRVKESFGEGVYYNRGVDRAYITDRDSTAWIDSTYGGASKMYVIYSVGKDFGVRSGDISEFDSTITPLHIQSVTRSGINDVTITWDKTKFPNAFQKYVVYDNTNYREPYSGRLTYHTVATIDDINTTQTMDKLALGTSSTYYIKLPYDLYNTDDDDHKAAFSDSAEVALGTRFHPDIDTITRIHYSQEAQAYIGYINRSTLVKMNSQLDIIDQTDVDLGTFHLSTNGKLIVGLKGSTVYVYDHNFTLLNQIDLYDIYPDFNAPYVYKPIISDTGIMLFNLRDSDPPSTYIRGSDGIDLMSGEHLETLTYDEGGLNFRAYYAISADGKYVVANWESPSGINVYKLQGDTLVYERDYSVGKRNRFLDNDTFLKIDYGYPEKLGCFTFPGNDLIWEVQLEFLISNVSVDTRTGLISYYDRANDKVIIRNLVDGTKYGTVVEGLLPSNITGNLMGDYYWVRNGYSKRIDDVLQ